MPEEKNKILLVEDDPLIIKMYQAKFSREGLNVTLAFNGADGLVALEKSRPDVILLDIMMPKMNGYELLKIIKSNPKYSSIPVVIMSSLGSDYRLVEKARELGVVDTIVKSDISLKDFVVKLKKILTGEIKAPAKAVKTPAEVEEEEAEESRKKMVARKIEVIEPKVAKDSAKKLATKKQGK
jgi:CheY-like chemotaxis protein